MRRLAVAVIALAVATPLLATKGSVFTSAGDPLPAVAIEVFEPQTSRAGLEQLVSGKGPAPIVTTKTGADGNFSFDAKTDGMIFVAAHADGFAPARVFVSASDDAIAMTLQRVETKSGSVHSANGPIAGATVLALDSMGDVVGSYRTDEHGRYSMPDPKRWIAGLCLHSRDYAESCHWETEMRGQAISMDFTAEPGSLVKGRVIDASGKPVANARVRAGRYDAVPTDEKGTFTLHVGHDMKTLHAVAGDLIGTASAANDASITLTSGHSINGFIRDDAGHPLKGSLVVIEDAGRWTTAIAGAKGEYTFTALDPNNYDVYVRSSDDLQIEPKQADVRKRQSAHLDFTATKRAFIRGVVRDEKKNAVGGATVMQLTSRMPLVYAQGALYQATAVTAADGTFKMLAGEPAGHLVALKSGFAAGKSDELKPDSIQKPVTITLPAGITISGSVVDSNDKPVSGAGIIVIQSESTLGTMPIAMAIASGAAVEWARTDDKGAFTIHLNRGLHDLGVWKRGYSGRDVGGVDVSDSTAPIRIKLDPAVQIRGRVVRKNGKPVDSGTVYATEQAQQSIGQGEVTSAGEFTIDSIQPGTYMIHYGGRGQAQGTKVVNAPASDVVIELPETVTLSGTVIDKGTGAPIRQFSVDVNAAADYVDNNNVEDEGGHFTQNVAPGAVELFIRAKGYVSARQTVTVAEGKAPQPLNIALVKGRTVNGRVSSADGHALAGVRVDTHADVNDVESDDEGEFEIETAPVNEITIELEKPGFMKATKIIPAGTTDQRVEITMNSGRKLTGRVVDKNGAAVEDAQVSADSETPGTESQNAKSDKAGAFTIEGLADGSYTVSAMKSGAGRAKIADVDVTKTQPLVLTLGSQPTGTIHGTVAGAANSGWMYATVSATGENDSASSQVSRDGTFVIENAPAGEVKVRAMLMAMQRQSTTKTVKVNLPPGGDVEVELTAAGDVSVRGTVTTSGSPSIGSTVNFSASSTDGQWWSTTTRADGTYELSGLAPGHYNVTVSDASASRGFSTETDLVSSTTFDINIVSVRIEGRVVDERGLPIDEAKVTLRPIAASQHSNDADATSDAMGAFAVTVQGDSAYTASAAKRGYAITSVDVAAGSSGPVLLTLRTSQGVRVRLIDGISGATLKGYVVVRDQNGLTIPTSGDPDPDGALSLPLPEGTYKVSASASEYASNTIALAVPSADASIVLTRGGTLVVQSHDDANELIRLVLPNGDEYVRCYCNGIAEIRLTGALTKVDHVASGTYRMEVVDAHNVTKRSIPVTITEGHTTTVDATKD